MNPKQGRFRNPVSGGYENGVSKDISFKALPYASDCINTTVQTHGSTIALARESASVFMHINNQVPWFRNSDVVRRWKIFILSCFCKQRELYWYPLHQFCRSPYSNNLRKFCTVFYVILVKPPSKTVTADFTLTLIATSVLGRSASEQVT